MVAGGSLRPSPNVVVRTWHLFDATNQTVGRLAQRISHLLCGKHHPTYNPNIDDGDNVTVINAEKIQFTGKRWQKKVYRYHTGYVGGLKSIPALTMLKKHPSYILRHAVSGMIHHNTFKHERLKRLRIYVGNRHEHEAQFTVDAVKELAMRQKQADEKMAEWTRHDKALPILTQETFDAALPKDPIMLQKWQEKLKKDEQDKAEKEKEEQQEMEKLRKERNKRQGRE